MLRIAILLLALTTPTLAQEALSGNQIAEKASVAMYYPANDGIATVTMQINSKSGNDRHREFILIRRDHEDNGDQQFLVIFKQPLEVREMGYLVHKYVSKDDNRWLYMPSLKIIRRIGASDKRSSFAGSHFFYEDVSGRHPSLDDHTLIQEDENSYTLKSTPKNKKGVEFSYYTSSISKENFLPLNIDYFDNNGKLIRSISTKEIKVIQGYPTITKSQVTDHKTQENTILEFKELSYNREIEESIFSTQTLQNPKSSTFK